MNLGRNAFFASLTSSEVSPPACGEERSPLRGSESRSLGRCTKHCLEESCPSHTAENWDTVWLSEVLHVGCSTLKKPC